MYIIQDRETGTMIDSFITIEEAENELARYEKQDKEDGSYVSEFYEIVEQGYKFVTVNTKNGNKYLYDEKDVERLFMCDTFNDSHIFKKDYDDYLDNLANEIGEDEDENEIREHYVNYWNKTGRNVYQSWLEYLKEMIEYETWTSPRGVEPVFRVIEIKEV